ncbi:MAG: four helix bundle protein [Syntrophaceae bacterium]|nr:four helix bundle protein [Syntrophaceae bacterium]
MQNYRNLIVWKKADEFAFRIYKLTEKFPKSEIFGLTSQLRRAALSVPTNIVEGYARGGKKEFSHFLNISISSLSEAQYLLDFSERLDYVKSDIKDLNCIAEEVSKLLWTFKKSLK